MPVTPPVILPPQISAAIARLVEIEAATGRQTRASRIAVGAIWYELKDSDVLADLTVNERAAILKAYGLNRHPSYLNKCARLYVMSLNGRLQQHDEFLKAGFVPRNSSEPYASMEVEDALAKTERQAKKPNSYIIKPIEQNLLDYIADKSTPPSVEFILGDCREEVHRLPDQSIAVLAASPPYHGARDYEHPRQMGAEASEELWRLGIVSFLNLARPKLKDTGILALVVGDRRSHGESPYTRSETLFSRHPAKPIRVQCGDGAPKGWPLLLPFLLFLDLIADGWHPIQMIVWHNTRPAPESVMDRCHAAHEFVLLLGKSENYHWNVGVGTPVLAPPGDGRIYQRERGIDVSDRRTKHYKDVWSIPSVSRGPMLTHPARHPEELYRRILRLTCPPGGKVLDPWGGAATTAVAALGLGLDSTMIELHENYMTEAKARIASIPLTQKWRKPLVTPHGTLHHGDALTEIRKLESGSIGFACLDPPFANGATELKWDEDLEWESIWEELWRVVKIDGFVAVCCNDRLKSRLIFEVQPVTYRYTLHWYRNRHANVMQGKSQPKRHVGYIAVFGRVAQKNYQPQTTPKAKPYTRPSKRSSTDFYGDNLRGMAEDGDITYDTDGPTDLRYYEFEPGEERKIPTQKPIVMGVDLILSMSRPYDTVLDICCGSASFLIAAQRCGRKFIGIERDADHFQIAYDRLSAGTEVRADAAD
jgi:site-specific DNA-methyltransferase (cytosine-N4-specific)